MDQCSSHIIDTYRSGQTLLERWKPGDYDIIVLDIFMGIVNGVDVAKEIRSSDQDVKLVFCSRSNEFAAESYQVNAQYYLVKPATPGSISNMLKRLNLDMMQRTKTVALPDGHLIIERQILYTEYYNHVVFVHLKDGEVYHLRANHSDVEELLASCGYIYSPSKGYLVNFHEVTQTTEEGFTLSSGDVIPISRRKKKEIQEAYTKFRFQKLRTEVEVT
jgi:DNA-binding LytR/AlgR family response regulator